MSRMLVLLVIGLGLLATGCARDVYLLEMTPDGDGFHRQLTVWRERPSGSDGKTEIEPISAEQLARLEQLYTAPRTIEDGKKHVFAGRFTDRTPQDIGGYGSWLRYESPLGVVTSYGERFRGSDDLEQQLADRRVSVDRLVDLTIGWLHSEMGDDPDFARIKDFLDDTLRHDLKNVAVYAWTHQVTQPYRGGDQDLHESIHRLWKYFEQRDYLRPSDLPRWVIAVTTFDQHPQRFLEAVQRLLARKMGVTEGQPIPPGLEFLADAERVRRSLENHLRQTDEYQQAYAKWRAEHPDAADEDAPSVFEFAGEKILAPIIRGGSPLFGGAVDLEVRLYGGRKPSQTNGQWDPVSGQVTWQHHLDADPLPAFSFAVWSDPNAEFQQAHFGRVLLSDEKLFHYVMWYNGLAAAERKVWDEFIDSCVPDSQLRARIEAFRFPEENADSAPLSDTPRALLLEALES